MLGSPVYANAAAAPLRDYITRTGDFHGKPVVVVLTAARDAAVAIEATTAMVTSAHGKVVGRFGYATMRPNKSDKAYAGSNADRAVEMARDEGRLLVTKPE